MPILAALLALTLGAAAQTQEFKKVPNDSLRVFVPGCTKGLIFTAGPRTEDQPGRSGIPEGMHLRMNGPKKVITDIKGHEGQMIELTGLVLKGAIQGEGISVGRVRILPGTSMTNAGSRPGPVDHQIVIDVEAWRQVPGECPR